MAVGIDPRLKLILLSLASTSTILVVRIAAYLYSGSLAILADSIHSVSDIISGLLALVAMRVALKGPDAEHPYGHGKAESLGSLGVSLALVAMFLYILYEAILRIYYDSYIHVDFTPLISALLLLSIAIDYWRSRALEKGAERYSSTLLASDALHYRSDLYATLSVLILSIAGILIEKGPLILYLDLGVGLAISLYFSIAAIKLARVAIDELMDRAPSHVVGVFRDVCRDLELHVRSVRARRSGSRVFIDAVIEMPGEIDLEEAHRIVDSVERIVRDSVRRDIDIVIHMEPREASRISEIAERCSSIASKVAGVLGVHDIEVREGGDGYHVRMHIEVSPSISLREASRIASSVENAIKGGVDNISSIMIHIEPKRGDSNDLHRVIIKAIQRDDVLKDNVRIKSIRALYIGGKLYIDITCILPGGLSVEEAHNIVSKLEQMVREEVGERASITIKYLTD